MLGSVDNASAHTCRVGRDPKRVFLVTVGNCVPTECAIAWRVGDAGSV